VAHGGHREGPDPNAVQRGSRFRKLQFVRVVTEDVIAMSILLRFKMAKPRPELTAGPGISITITFMLALKVSVQSKLFWCPLRAGQFVALQDTRMVRPFGVSRRPQISSSRHPGSAFIFWLPEWGMLPRGD